MGGRLRYDDSTDTLVRDAPRRPLGAIVNVETGGGRPARLRFGSGKCVIGSGADCDLVLADGTVSRRHAVLELVPEGVAVEDAGSRNGTFYLGQRVERMVLPFGGRLQLGSALIGVELDREALTGDLAPTAAPSYRGLVGPSLAMRQLFALLERLEGSLVTVLIEGESGTGKELVASALHQGSRVAPGPFVALNCGAIATELVASELFGHRRGAFSGAHEARLGAFASADGGTLFLDEIGELPLEVQPALLRALESGEVRAVGSDEVVRVKVRLLAATNRNLGEQVREGGFREDLYYRLAVVRVRIPPLRDRPEDVGALVQHFARGSGARELPREVVARLEARPWRGNVRELRNVVEAYVALGVLPGNEGTDPGPALDRALSELVDVRRPYPEQKDALVERFTRLYLERLLEHTGGNQTRAAELAGLGRAYLGRLLAKYDLK
jgi:DNA-binding NtrC family response regulator